MLTEHVILSLCPDFVLSRTPQHLRRAPSGCFQMSVTFLERRKQNQFFIPPLCLIRMKSCNCIKIKSISFIMLKKTALIYPSNFLIQNTKNHFMVAFYFMFTFSFKSLHLILKKLIKHENKFDRKAFHDRENSENLFSQFSYFMKGFKKYIMNIYR